MLEDELNRSGVSLKDYSGNKLKYFTQYWDNKFEYTIPNLGLGKKLAVGCRDL